MGGALVPLIDKVWSNTSYVAHCSIPLVTVILNGASVGVPLCLFVAVEA